MKRTIYFFLTALILAAFSACSSYNYNYYTAAINKTNLSGYNTFAWNTSPNEIKGNEESSNDLADSKIREAATAALISKGLKLTQNTPDLVIGYTAKVGTGTRTHFYYGGYYGGYYGWGHGWGWGGYGWRGGWGYPYYYGAPYYPAYAEKEHYKEGTLTIDLIDTHTGKIVWRGFGVGEVHKDTKKTIKHLPKVVDGVLAQLKLTPGKVKSSY
ncbi:MAG TPA: DUF4136 domain-containing protein [Mucilaginibacter sp.]|jgi:hypothetical protein